MKLSAPVSAPTAVDRVRQSYARRGSLFKKIAIVVTMGALSLTGCSAAPGMQAAATPSSPSGQAPVSGPAVADPSDAGAAIDAPASEEAPVGEETELPARETSDVAVEESYEIADGTGYGTAVPADGAEPVAAAKVDPDVPAAGTAPAAAAAPAPAPVAPQAAVAATGSGTEAAAKFGWGPVVAGDEFSNTGAPDSTKWSVYKGSGHAGKGVRSAAAWSVANGVATVSGDAAGTTGGMSAKFAQQKYGRWEVRMKTSDRDPKYHPVAILWPNRGSGATNCPEIDFAEGSTDTTTMKFFLHYKCGGSDFQTYSKTKVDSTQWHNYAVEWTPAGITGFIDGVKTFSDTNPAHQPTVGMHQTLQLDWFPDGSATKPSQMHVDWVRVYK